MGGVEVVGMNVCGVKIGLGDPTKDIAGVWQW